MIPCSRYALITILIMSAFACASAQQLIEPRLGKPIVMPTRYEAHRFVATPTTADGTILSLFTDSAGGLFLFADAVQRLKLTATTLDEKEGGKELKVTPLPAFKPGKAIPPPLGASLNHQLFVFSRPATVRSVLEKGDGMLGQQWFAGRVWTFDYPRRKLLWRAPGDLPKHDKAHEVKLAFKLRGSGERAGNFARLQIEVDGEILDFLLDTGATNVLSDEVLKQINDGGPADRGTSFLTRSTFEKWHKKHPEWRALDNIKSLSGAAMIEVPSLTIGGYKIGPVWFTVQPDAAFHQYMAQFMDKPTEGAIGGSALHYLRVTVDWPNALAVFEQP